MIQVTSVSFRYTGALVLDRVNVGIGPGLTLLVGPNGCGKSTLLRLLAGVERPHSGRVTIDGHDLWQDEVEARRQLAYVPEHPDLTPYASLIEILRLVCRLRGVAVARAPEVLEQVGLGDRKDASVRELSAGQRRRVLLAAAWIGEPQVALLDEPLELLDRPLRAVVLEWIARSTRAGGTVIVVSHEIEPFLAMATAAMTVRGGTVDGPIALPPAAAARLALVDRLSGLRGITPGSGAV